MMQTNRAAYRRFKNRIVLGMMALAVIVCLIPLAALMTTLLSNGLGSLSWSFLRQRTEEGAGVGNAILGSFLILLAAAVFAVPLGLALGIYLTQRGTTRLASASRLLLDVLSGIPAIIVGVFIYTIVVRKSGFSLHVGFSTLAGALALSIIMLPIFARATEEALKAIPKTVDEAGLGLGLPRRTVVLRILIRAASPSILTGLFLALARVAGEAAPLLFTTDKSEYWPSHGVKDLATLKPLTEPISSLPMVVFNYTTSPKPELNAQAWGAALLLVIMVLTIRLSTKAYTAWRYGGKDGHV
jgi:phosphate transport system permease protein